MDNRTLFRKLLWFVALRLPYYSFNYLDKKLNYEKYPFIIEYFVYGTVKIFRAIVIYPALFFLLHSFFSITGLGFVERIAFSMQTMLIGVLVLPVWWVLVSAICLIYLFFTHKKYDLSVEPTPTEPPTSPIEPPPSTYAEEPSTYAETSKSPLTFAEKMREEFLLHKISNKELFNRLLLVQLIFALKNPPLVRGGVWGRIKYENHPYIREEYANVMYTMHLILNSSIFFGLFALLFAFELNQLPVFLIAVFVIAPIPVATLLASVPCLLYMYFTHKKHL